MKNKRGKILWVDDEIQHLKPHILFLEEKGYSFRLITDKMQLNIKRKGFDLVLLDHLCQDGWTRR